MTGPQESPSRPLQILCVDDEPAIRTILAQQLVRMGHCVHTASDGQEALGKVAAGMDAFDLVITDNQMPKVTGVELAERLRAGGYSGAILFFTSTLDGRSLRRIAAVNAVAVVEKGSALSTLLSAIERVHPDAKP